MRDKAGFVIFKERLSPEDFKDTNQEEFETSSQYSDDLSSEESDFSEYDSCDETDIIDFLSMTAYEYFYTLKFPSFLYLYEDLHSENEIVEQTQIEQKDLIKPIHTQNLKKFKNTNTLNKSSKTQKGDVDDFKVTFQDQDALLQSKNDLFSGENESLSFSDNLKSYPIDDSFEVNLEKRILPANSDIEALSENSLDSLSSLKQFLTKTQQWQERLDLASKIRDLIAKALKLIDKLLVICDSLEKISSENFVKRKNFCDGRELQDKTFSSIALTSWMQWLLVENRLAKFRIIMFLLSFCDEEVYQYYIEELLSQNDSFASLNISVKFQMPAIKHDESAVSLSLSCDSSLTYSEDHQHGKDSNMNFSIYDIPISYPKNPDQELIGDTPELFRIKSVPDMSHYYTTSNDSKSQDLTIFEKSSTKSIEKFDQGPL
ncbi:unnamed protein product [Moneuplotes crassus]|uniref:Uncharacterized protein n=1 Tax=Euplotes crassus TaxID=5936 RepID=A0AAD1UDF7_EUPCR|nr:unnamed protein product [Moneuplotes crassus]